MMNRYEYIERLREKCPHDLYVVTGQLNSRTNDPIDSWTFFQWLQRNDIPSRYVIWKEHFLYQQLVKEDALKDVIVLNGNGEDEELLEHDEILARCRAFVQENAAMNRGIHDWLYQLDDCRLVFLQHGIAAINISELTWRYFPPFNDMNVSSKREKELIESLMPKQPWSKDLCFVAGLPRFDQCRDLSSELDDNYVFVMFTWRSSLEKGIDNIHRSLYWQNLIKFFSKENIQRFRDNGIKLIVALHHHIQNRVADFNLGENVKFIRQEEIKYWVCHAKACITDCSSISFDFMFQHKPTFYWIPDKDDPYLDMNDADDGAKVQAALGLQHHFYNICKTPEELMAMTCQYAKHHFQLEAEKCAIADSFFKYRSDFSFHIYYQIEQRLMLAERKKSSDLSSQLKQATEMILQKEGHIQRLNKKKAVHLRVIRLLAYLSALLLIALLYSLFAV